MIKYALTLPGNKISFINEIANLCEAVERMMAVAKGMGFDKRIGFHFLNAGIGMAAPVFPRM